MRKMILALVVVLIAAPAWGAVTINLTADGNVVTIGYDASAEAELVRAFALDVTATGGTIDAVSDYVVGDDNGGYGIFPANFSRFITVDGQTGEVADWGVAEYTPVADVNDTGAAGGLGDAAITLEMGSLYDTAAPGVTGTLCTVTASEGTTQVCVTLNDVRGGIVLENAAQAALAGGEVCVDLGGPICVPQDQEADYLAFGSPDCWCDAYHCDGDADGKEQGIGSKKHRVGTNDLSVLIANWNFKGTEGTFNPCADVNHKAQGIGSKKVRVGTNDLGVLIANWTAKTADMAGDCPMK